MVEEYPRIQRIEALVSAINPGQVCIEPSDDTDLGYRMYCYKDLSSTPISYKLLAKGKPGLLLSLILSGLAGDIGLVRHTDTGLLIGGKISVDTFNTYLTDGPLIKDCVTSLVKDGETKLQGDLVLYEGANVTITQETDGFTIASTGGGGISGLTPGAILFGKSDGSIDESYSNLHYIASELLLQHSSSTTATLVKLQALTTGSGNTNDATAYVSAVKSDNLVSGRAEAFIYAQHPKIGTNGPRAYVQAYNTSHDTNISSSAFVESLTSGNGSPQAYIGVQNTDAGEYLRVSVWKDRVSVVSTGKELFQIRPGMTHAVVDFVYPNLLGTLATRTINYLNDQTNNGASFNLRNFSAVDTEITGTTSSDISFEASINNSAYPTNSVSTKAVFGSHALNTGIATTTIRACVGPDLTYAPRIEFDGSDTMRFDDKHRYTTDSYKWASSRGIALSRQTSFNMWQAMKLLGNNYENSLFDLFLEGCGYMVSAQTVGAEVKDLKISPNDTYSPFYLEDGRIMFFEVILLAASAGAIGVRAWKYDWLFGRLDPIAGGPRTPLSSSDPYLFRGADVCGTPHYYFDITDYHLTIRVTGLSGITTNYCARMLRKCEVTSGYGMTS